jgi:O-glycosyl hydrolase
MNALGEKVAGISESLDHSKQDRRDIWVALSALRDEDQRIDRMVNAIAAKVAGIATVATIAQAFIVWYITGVGHR